MVYIQYFRQIISDALSSITWPQVGHRMAKTQAPAVLSFSILQKIF